VDDPTLATNKKIIKKNTRPHKMPTMQFFFQFPQEGDWLPCYSSGMPCGVFILGFVNPIGYAKIN
jgi:hypothetical protein